MTAILGILISYATPISSCPALPCPTRPLSHIPTAPAVVMRYLSTVPRANSLLPTLQHSSHLPTTTMPSHAHVSFSCTSIIQAPTAPTPLKSTSNRKTPPTTIQVAYVQRRRRRRRPALVRAQPRIRRYSIIPVFTNMRGTAHVNSSVLAHPAMSRPGASLAPPSP